MKLIRKESRAQDVWYAQTLLDAMNISNEFVILLKQRFFSAISRPPVERPIILQKK